MWAGGALRVAFGSSTRHGCYHANEDRTGAAYWFTSLTIQSGASGRRPATAHQGAEQSPGVPLSPPSSPTNEPQFVPLVSPLHPSTSASAPSSPPRSPLTITAHSSPKISAQRLICSTPKSLSVKGAGYTFRQVVGGGSPGAGASLCSYLLTVCDGHDGPAAADFVVRQLPAQVQAVARAGLQCAVISGDVLRSSGLIKTDKKEGSLPMKEPPVDKREGDEDKKQDDMEVVLMRSLSNSLSVSPSSSGNASSNSTISTAATTSWTTSTADNGAAMNSTVTTNTTATSTTTTPTITTPSPITMPDGRRSFTSAPSSPFATPAPGFSTPVSLIVSPGEPPAEFRLNYARLWRDALARVDELFRGRARAISTMSGRECNAGACMVGCLVDGALFSTAALGDCRAALLTLRPAQAGTRARRGASWGHSGRFYKKDKSRDERGSTGGGGTDQPFVVFPSEVALPASLEGSDDSGDEYSNVFARARKSPSSSSPAPSLHPVSFTRQRYSSVASPPESPRRVPRSSSPPRSPFLTSTAGCAQRMSASSSISSSPCSPSLVRQSSAGLATVEAGATPVQFEWLSHCHRCSEPGERARIYEGGGSLVNGRLGGMLEPSRSIGDYDVKDKLPAGVLSARPEVRVVEVRRPCLILLASDGVWDTLREAEVALLTRRAAGPALWRQWEAHAEEEYDGNEREEEEEHDEDIGMAVKQTRREKLSEEEAKELCGSESESDKRRTRIPEFVERKTNPTYTSNGTNNDIVYSMRNRNTRSRAHSDMPDGCYPHVFMDTGGRHGAFMMGRGIAGEGGTCRMRRVSEEATPMRRRPGPAPFSSEDLSRIARRLVSSARKKGSGDDCTAAAIYLTPIKSEPNQD